jgi:hypothetical protein
LGTFLSHSRSKRLEARTGRNKKQET